MKFDLRNIDLSAGMTQASVALKVLHKTPAFIKKNQLWKGFLDHKWIMIVTILIMGTLSVTLYNDVHDYFSPDQGININIDIDIPTKGFDVGIQDLEEAALISPENAKERLEAGKNSLSDAKDKLEDHHKPLFSGSYKFLILIFLEILIFHFAVGTNNILKNENRILVLKEFSRAQIRMIKVMAHKWIFGLLIYVLVSIVFGIFGLSVLTNFIMFFVYAFFMGFAFLDNYLEQYHYSIKKSSKHIRTHFGAATLFGVIASAGMSIPVIGPILMPFIFAVAATIYGHEVAMERETVQTI